MNKKEQPRRRSLNDRLDAELASAESIPVAGIITEPKQEPTPHLADQPQQEGGAEAATTGATQPLTSITGGTGVGAFLTKKATTIMPKEVFSALQRYCTDTDTPKHRALYLFILDGLHAAATITDAEYQRFRDMAALLTTTYGKKQ